MALFGPLHPPPHAARHMLLSIVYLTLSVFVFILHSSKRRECVCTRSVAFVANAATVDWQISSAAACEEEAHEAVSVHRAATLWTRDRPDRSRVDRRSSAVVRQGVRRGHHGRCEQTDESVPSRAASLSSNCPGK